jgi:inhibitor of KinA
MIPAELGSFQLYPLGDAAIVLKFGGHINLEAHTRIQAIAGWLAEHPAPWMVEWVPAFTTLTLYYNPWLASDEGKWIPYERVVHYIQEMLPKVHVAPSHSSRLVNIPVCYGGSYGPDLPLVASHNSLTIDEVVEIHSQAEYLVYMIGFAPGFPYLGGMSEDVATPRRQSPRPAIPAGSVGIAGAQTGIYSLETPGGWQLIGRTPLTLFDPKREQPSLLSAGDRVHFVPVCEAEFKSIQEKKA